MELNKDIKKDKNNFKKEIYIKIIILIILIILNLVTSFRSGSKLYFVVRNFSESNFELVNTDVARWNFKVKIIIGNEVIYHK